MVRKQRALGAIFPVAAPDVETDGKPVVIPGGEAVDDDINGENIEAEEEEIAPRATMTTPVLPSAADVEKHREDHMPYRPWCDECVEGQGREDGHMSATKAEKSVSLISFDYCFLSKSGIVSRQEWALQEEQVGQNI